MLFGALAQINIVNNLDGGKQWANVTEENEQILDALKQENAIQIYDKHSNGRCYKCIKEKNAR